MNQYRVTISTRRFKPYMRCSPKNWEPGTTNDHMAALDGWSTVEPDITALRWRLMMFSGAGPWGDEAFSSAYKKWNAQPENKLTFHDKLCDMEREAKITPPGFHQSSFPIDKYLEEVEEKGTLKIPFSAVYDMRQYPHRMDGCYLLVEKVTKGSSGMKKLVKADFNIVGHFTGSRLAGREHQFLYDVYYNGQQLNRYGFTSKKRASAWLGALVRECNATGKRPEPESR